MSGRYSKYHSNYILSKRHMDTSLGRINERDWVTIGGWHRLEKGKKPYYFDGNLIFTDNSFVPYKRKHKYGQWSGSLTYDDVKDSKDDVNVVRVNNDSDDIRDYAYYGSAVELVRTTVLNIINTFPLSVGLSKYPISVPGNDGEYIDLDSFKQLISPLDPNFAGTGIDEDFILNQFSKYTFNGCPITTYDVTPRKLYERTQEGLRTTKSLVFTKKLYKEQETSAAVLEPVSIKTGSVYGNNELVVNTKYDIKYGSYVIHTVELGDNGTANVGKYRLNDDKLSVNGTYYPITNEPPLMSKTVTLEYVPKITGYGITSGGTFDQSGSSFVFSMPDENEECNTITLKGGYTYKCDGLGGMELSSIANTTITPVYRANADGKNLIFPLTPSRLIDISNYVTELPDYGVRSKTFVFDGKGSEVKSNYNGKSYTLSEEGVTEVVIDDFTDGKAKILLEYGEHSTVTDGFVVVYGGSTTFSIWLDNGSLWYELDNSSATSFRGSFTHVPDTVDVRVTIWVETSDTFSVTVNNVNRSYDCSKTYYVGQGSRFRALYRAGTYTKYDWTDEDRTFSGGNINLAYSALDNKIRVYASSNEAQMPLGTQIYVVDQSHLPNTGSNFTFMLLKKSVDTTIRSTRKTINPCVSLTGDEILTAGNYFVEVDGNKHKWQCLCYTYSDASSSVVAITDKVRYYQGKLCLVHRDNRGYEYFDDWNVSSYLLNNVKFYRKNENTVGYTYYQYFSDEEFDAFEDKSLWRLNNGRLNDWLPTTNMLNGLDVYVDEKCRNCSCEDNNCQVYLPISSMSGIKDEDGEYRNMPLYTIDITYEQPDGLQVPVVVEAYMRSGNFILLTKTDKLDMKPVADVYKEYFDGLSGFEKKLLTLNSKPHYKNRFLTPVETDRGWVFVYRDYTWPSIYDETIGYSIIDVESGSYDEFLKQLISMAESYDELYCDNLYRRMTHEAIKNFDWTYTREYVDGEEQYNIEGGKRMENILRFMARVFDDIKRKIDGIGLSNSISYDGYNNMPDAEVSDKLSENGWDITSVIPEIEDTDPWYIDDGGDLIPYDVWDALPPDEKTAYQEAYLNIERNIIVPKSKADGNEVDYTSYRPFFDLSDVFVTGEFVEDNIEKQEGFGDRYPNKWFSTNDDNYYGVTHHDIEFMRRLKLSSRYIFSSKGTRHSIEMVFAIFGFGIGDDYVIEEKYRTTIPKPVGDNLSLISDIESINSTKDEPKFYDDIYSGVPLKDIMIGNSRYVVPFYTQDRAYDGDLYFQMNGGWGKNNCDGYGFCEYLETVSYLHMVMRVENLLDVDPSAIENGDIYYVVNISSYVTQLDGIVPENVSHYFKVVDKYVPSNLSSWENITLNILDLEDDDAAAHNRDVKMVKYLDGIVSTELGNNPHVGFGRYDDGVEYFEYMEKPFKYALDNDLIYDQSNKVKAEELTFSITEQRAVTDDTYDGTDDSKVLQLTTSSVDDYYLNDKCIIIRNNVSDNEYGMYSSYFRKVMLPYILQVVPSTAILVLEGF